MHFFALNSAPFLSSYFDTHTNTMTQIREHPSVSFLYDRFTLLSVALRQPLIWRSQGVMTDLLIPALKMRLQQFLPRTSAWGLGPGSGRGCLRHGGVWGSLWPLSSLLLSLPLLCLLRRTVHPPHPETSPLSLPVCGKKRRARQMESSYSAV